MSNRFSTNPFTLREMLLGYKAGKGDIEALAELLKKRCIDESLDVLDLAGDEVNSAVTEMYEAIAEGQSIDTVLSKLRY
jgi:alpha-D-ribose 1-methylphosphonate 5-phosphate C-P lyase